MPHKKRPLKSNTKPTAALYNPLRWWRGLARLWHKSFWYKSLLILCASVTVVLSGSYGISYWYLAKHRNEPLQLGVTFIPRYARYFDLDPQETMQAIIDDLGVKRFRLVSYWDDIEKVQGVYDFSELDWQFKKAEAAHANVSLALGLRQPRWPECHMPSWAASESNDVWYGQLKTFMTKVVERYKNSPALASYQVENEFFMTIFGNCSNFDRQRLIDEYNLVKKLDPSKPIVVTRSNNWGGVPINEPTPDLYGVAVYKRVWDQTITHRYFEYPYPPWFYGFLAGMGEILHGKPLIIHELQMEPWMPDGYDLRTSTMAEQDKSMNAERMAYRFKYAKDTGIRIIDTWGVEWWYWRKVHFNDSSLWNTAAQEFRKTD